MKTSDVQKAELTHTADTERRPPEYLRTEGENGEQDIDSVPLYRKKRVLIPLFVVLLAAAAAVWYWYAVFRDYDSTDDAFIDADRVEISSKILGRITKMAVEEGDSVKEGEVIVRLDDSDLRAQEEQAKAVLVSAEQNVALAKVNLGKAADDYQRSEKQYKDNVIPQEQFVHSQNARDAAQAQYSIAIAQVGTAKAQLGVIRTTVQNTSIVSPMSGVISKRWVLVGDVVQAAQPIFTVYNLSNVWVTANFEETKLASLALSDPVQVTVDTYPDQQFHGKVFRVGSYTAAQFSLIPPNNASGNFTKVTQRIPVKISVDNPDPRRMPLLPGMSVEVKVKVK